MGAEHGDSVLSWATVRLPLPGEWKLLGPRELEQGRRWHKRKQFLNERSSMTYAGRRRSKATSPWGEARDNESREFSECH